MMWTPIGFYPTTREKIFEWSLVLSALNILHRIQEVEEGLIIEVREEEKDRAIREILEYERENSEEDTNPTKDIYYSMESSLWILFFLFLFHIITQNSPYPFIPLGCMDSFAIYKGEWWRIVTSLTLHKNIVHVLSNIFWQGVFMYFLLRHIPPSTAWNMCFLGGILGNLLSYLYHPISHVSLGFSTCVFATIGVSIGIRGAKNPKDIGLYVVSGLGLFAMLGIGTKGVDVGSHIFGLISGFILGTLSQLLGITRLKLKSSFLFFILFVIVAICWSLAIFWGKNYLEL